MQDELITYIMSKDKKYLFEVDNDCVIVNDAITDEHVETIYYDAQSLVVGLLRELGHDAVWA